MLKQFGIVPEPGMILMCDFIGNLKPEIDKRRHVIVVSPKSHNNWGTSLVVPVSTVRPNTVSRVHVQLDPQNYGCFDAAREQWVKANLLDHVRTERLDRVRSNGRWGTPLLDPADYERVIKAVRGALALTI